MKKRNRTIKPTKLITPEEPKTIKCKNAVVYWADPMLSPVSETLEDEYDLNVGRELKHDFNLEFENVKYVFEPPLLAWNVGIFYEILFFDWGGMSIGNSLLESFCRNILEEAEENPSKLYVTCSMMTLRAMNEALTEMKSRPANVLLTVTEFGEFFKRELK
jgi:hypothetical protein